MEAKVANQETASPSTPAAPSSQKRYFGPYVAASIVIAFSFIFLLLFGPFGHPLTASPGRFLLFSFTFFLSSVIALFYYIAQLKRKFDQSGWDRSMTAILLCAFLGLIIGVTIPILLTWANIPALGIVASGMNAANFLNGFLFAIFTFGAFLSLACRLSPDNKRPIEITVIWVISAICAVALIFAIGFIAKDALLLKTLGALSQFTFLGINIFISVLFSVIALSTYVVKFGYFIVFYLQTHNRLPSWWPWPLSEEDKEKFKNRYWEHGMSTGGVVVGFLLFILIPTFNIFGGPWYVDLFAGIIAWDKCASAFSKIGRSFFDEPKLIPHPAKTGLLTSISKHVNGAYAARVIAAMGLFTMLAFGIYGLSFMAVSGQSLIVDWALGSPVFCFSLVALSLTCIVNWTMGLLKPKVENIPSCQAIESATQAVEILKNDECINNPELSDALFIHIERAHKLLSPEWRECLVYYSIEHNPNADYEFLNILAEAQKPLLANSSQISLESIATQLGYGLTIPKELKKHFFLENKVGEKVHADCIIIKLQHIFATLRNVTTIDPTFKPKPSSSHFFFAMFGIILSLPATLFLLLYTFTGGVSLAASAWVLPLAVILGLFSWILLRKFILDNSSGGPYTTWAAIAGIATTIFGGLSIVAMFGSSIIATNLSSSIGVFVFITLCSLALLHFFSRKAKNYAAQKTSQEKIDSISIKIAHRALIAFKIILASGFLLLSFACIGVLFDLQNIGALQQLMSFATNIIIETLGIGGLVEGTTWLSIFTIFILTTSSFIAFELFKSTLKTAPNSTAAIDEYKDWIALGTLIFKFIFTSVLILALTANPSMFLAGAQVTMLPIFLVMMVITPLFVGNAKIPFKTKFQPLAKFEAWFNRHFGLQPAESHQILLREVLLMVVLTAVFAITAWATHPPTEFALPVVGINIMATMLLRGALIAWNAHDPIGKAWERLARLAQPAQVEELPAAPAGLPEQRRAVEHGVQVASALLPPPTERPKRAGSNPRLLPPPPIVVTRDDGASARRPLSPTPDSPVRSNVVSPAVSPVRLGSEPASPERATSSQLPSQPASPGLNASTISVDSVVTVDLGPRLLPPAAAQP